MVCDNIFSIIKDTFDLLVRTQQKGKIHWDLHDMLFNIIQLLIADFNNKKIASSIFIGQFITDLKDEDPKNITGSVEKIIEFFFNVFEIKEKCSEFMQFSGLDALLTILKDNSTNTQIIKNSFKLMSKIVNSDDEFKIVFKNLKIIEFVNEILSNPLIKKDKEFTLIAQILINDINDIKTKINIEEINSISESIMKNKDGLGPEIRNFLTSGRMIRLY
jgi:hypothetical protein